MEIGIEVLQGSHRVLIVDGLVVKAAVVPADARRAIRLWDNEERRGPFRFAALRYS